MQCGGHMSQNSGMEIRMKYRLKIALCVVCFLSFAFGIGGSMLISVSFSSNLEQEKKTAVNSYQSMLNMLSVVNSVSTQAYYGNIADVLEQLDQNGGGNWSALRLIVDDNVIYEGGNAAENIRSVTLAEETDQYDLQIFKEHENNYLQVSGALEAGEKILYLDGLYDITSIYHSREEQIKIYRYVFLVIIILGAAISWVMASLLTKPMRELSRTARQISGGDLSGRVQIQSKDEIGLLAEDFNHMADEMEDYIGQLKDAMVRQEEFMGSFAHEMKTPMTAIIGYADLMRSQQLSENQQRDAANYIFSEGKRLENLSLKLLDLLVVKNDAMEFVMCRPDKLVKDVAQLMRPALSEKNITLQRQCETGSCMLEPSLVMSLLINLVDNARKAMDDGGVITVVEKITEDGCCFVVEDQGSGIPDEELEKITDAFYRVDKSRARSLGGVGLGLALCKEIAAAHNGSIAFENVEPSGTRVTVLLKGGAVR